MLGNNISLFLGVVEMMIFANIFYGIPFVQQIFTGQKIFMKEYCTDAESRAGEYCSEASAMVGTMWTIGTIFSCSGPIIFGTLQTLIGSHWTRVIAGSLTSTGLLLMSFYESSVYYLLVGVTFVAFPSISYIILNSFVAPVYKSITTPLIVMIPGLINSSATSMLVAKKLFEAGLPLNKYFLILFILSFVIHIRTLFFIPSVPIPKPLEPHEQPPGYVEPKFNMMKSAIAVELFCKNKKEKEIEKENQPIAQNRQPIRDHLPQMKNWIYPIYGAYYTIITFRINTIKGWMTSWIQHAYRSLNCTDFQEKFSEEDCLGEIENSITFLIDINGYTYFFLAVIPFLPAFLIKFFSHRYPKDYHFGELRTKLNALLIQMTFCIAVTIGFSIMMTYQASAPDSRALDLTLIFLSLLIVPIHYSTPWLLLFSYFPPPMVQFLYAVMTVPMIFVSLVNDPLYKIILSGQSDAENFDFKTVSYGMAGASGICIFSVIYLFFDTQKFIKTKEIFGAIRKRQILAITKMAEIGTSDANNIKFVQTLNSANK